MKRFPRTKIVCTLGPATDREGVLRQMLEGGMNVARFNFSHGNHREQKERLERLVALREELNLPVATLLDTKGPEIRLKTFAQGKVEVKEGQMFTFAVGDLPGDSCRVCISYEDLYQDVKVGDHILVDDGLVQMKILAIEGKNIVCRVGNDGILSDRKGVNVPNVPVSMPYINEKDYEDLLFGIEHGFDFIAASFTRSADDILQMRKVLEEHGGGDIHIIAKIENKQGVENIDEILKVADGIMVARGDMGVEIPLEEVPIIQKMIIQKVYNVGKQVITATQMLDSMMKYPRPTRAEAADVANAVYDGTSAIMLSGETAAGEYPVEALETMVKIAVRAEDAIDYGQRMKKREEQTNPDITNAIAHATCTTALDLGASGILCVTKSGRTARMISKYRPGCQILGCCMEEKVRRQLSLSWGVIPIRIEGRNTSDESFDLAVQEVKKTGRIQEGDVVVIAAGVPLGVSGSTNLLKVHILSDNDRRH